MCSSLGEKFSTLRRAKGILKKIKIGEGITKKVELGRDGPRATISKEDMPLQATRATLTATIFDLDLSNLKKEFKTLQITRGTLKGI
ncbi:hypothetical protein LZ554_009549 [Drepanopeziza brunnea f. sp. 'monogermtubi']|nr:hypothetical protein LZ554_009549 [Drepanopeziza brunnea f. sp. 'monogermtubi']